MTRPPHLFVVAVAGLAMLALAACAPASAEAPRSTPPTASTVRPFWSDEFNGKAGARPNASVWTTEVGNREQEGWWNNELQYYTRSKANSAQDGAGHLVITARRASSGAKLPCYPSGNCRYTSARLTTESTVALTYGRADIRAKLPTGRGLLPAIWMLGNNGVEWPGQGELDVVEVVGNEPRTVYGTAHGPTYFNENGIGKSVELPADASAAYHVYSIEKRPNTITWLVDDRPYFTLTPADLPAAQDWVFEQDMHFLLNVAVGGDWPGRPSGRTHFPAAMSVDYIRLYGTGVVTPR